jgi:hypothetical protein
MVIKKKRDKRGTGRESELRRFYDYDDLRETGCNVANVVTSLL